MNFIFTEDFYFFTLYLENLSNKLTIQKESFFSEKIKNNL